MDDGEREGGVIAKRMIQSDSPGDVDIKLMLTVGVGLSMTVIENAEHGDVLCVAENGVNIE